MTWLSNIFKKRDTGISVADSQLNDLFRSYANNFSGVTITAESVLGNPVVFRAVNLVAGAFAKIPVHIFRYTDDGREKATALTQYRLLLKQPHELYTAYTFKHSLLSNALIYGNGYAYIERNQFGTPVQLWLLDPRHTWTNYQQGVLTYRTQINNQQVVFGPADCMHIRGLSLNGLVGVPLLEVLSNAYGYGLSVQRYATQYFKNNGKPSIIIELAPHLKDTEKVKEFRRLWAEQHNSGNSSAPAFLTSGNKVVPYSNSNEAGQLIGNLEHDILTVANCIGVPASKLGSKQNTSYSSLESESTAFLQDIDCWLVQFEQECEIKLLTESAKINATHYVEFERKALIKIDSKTESETLISEFNNGIISFEEMRAARNMPLDKDDKDEWRRPANIVVESLEAEQMKMQQDQLKAQQDQAKQQAEQQQPATEDNPEDKAEDTKTIVEADDSRLQQMTILALDRLLNRVSKSNEDPRSHRSIFVQSLSPFENSAEFTDELLQRIATAENPKKYIESLDSAELIKGLK
jgi:HK97 family phage portal protein